MGDDVIWRIGGKYPRVAVVGAGAIGCYYGGHLAANGVDVHFLMRSDYEAVRENGLTIITRDGKTRLDDVHVYRSTEEIGECDVLLIALKTTNNDALKELLPPLVGDGTRLLTLQNGLGNEELLAELFPDNPVLGGLCFICLNRIAPGTIRNFSFGRVSVGRSGAPADAFDRALVDAMSESGLDADLVEDLALERWRKQVWNVPFNGLSIVAGGVPVDVLLASEEIEHEVRAIMNEVISVSRAEDLAIDPSYVDFEMKRTRKMGDYKPSSLIDYLAGKPVEVESIWGNAVRRARGIGVKVPKLELLYALLKQACIT